MNYWKERQGRKIINHYTARTMREIQSLCPWFATSMYQPPHWLQISGTLYGFPCPFPNVVIHSINLALIILPNEPFLHVSVFYSNTVECRLIWCSSVCVFLFVRIKNFGNTHKRQILKKGNLSSDTNVHNHMTLTETSIRKKKLYFVSTGGISVSQPRHPELSLLNLVNLKKKNLFL